MNKEVFEKIRLRVLESQRTGNIWNSTFNFVSEYKAVQKMSEEMRKSERSMGLMLREKLETFRFDYLPEEPLIGRLCEQQASQEEVAAAQTYYWQQDKPWGLSEGQCGHCEPDYPFLLENGVDGVRSIILKKKAEKIAPAYENFLAAIDAFSVMIDHAAKTAHEAGNEEVAAVCRKIAHKKPETFREAIQLLWFALIACQHGDRAYLVDPGRLDRTLLPYYKNIAHDEALELVTHLYLMLNSGCPRGLAYGVMVAGSTKANAISYLALEALRECRLVYPGVGVCVNDNTPEDLIRLAVDVEAAGYPNPAFFNDSIIRRGLEHYGVPHADSDNYINSTCVEITPSGASNVYVASPYYNLCATLLEAMEEKYSSFDDLVTAFKKRLAKKVDDGVAEQIRCRESRKAHMRRPFLSMLTKSCIDRGLDIEEGGAEYNWIECSFVGLANLVDSLFVIKKEVFEHHNLTLEEMLKLCRNDFENAENIRLRFLNSHPKYGQNNPEVDSLIPGFIAFFNEICAKHKVPPYESHYIPGTFCWEMHQRLGAKTCATPDGRRSEFPFADGAGPAQGREKFGPTSATASVCSWDQHLLIGGSAFNMKYTKSVFATDSSRDKLVSLIRTFIRGGGFQTQINMVDRETLLKADKDPEAYPDLVVRIGGYTDYFSRMSEGMRKEVIMRMQYETI